MKRSKLFRFALPSAWLLLLLGPRLAAAQDTTTITEGNSTFVLNHPTTCCGTFPFPGEWFVDGRRILTYVSAPAYQIDLTHHHGDGHVRINQLHAAGQLGQIYGWPPGISGGLVYTLNGSASGSGNSQLTELVELTLSPGITTPQTFELFGFGFNYAAFFPPGDFEVPDLTGLCVTGTTVVFVSRGSFSVAPFGGDLITRFRSFTGFNPYTEIITLNPGSTLRMITELNVSPASQ